MLPKDHQIVTAKIWAITRWGWDGVSPYTSIPFDDNAWPITPEEALASVKPYPKRVYLSGNPLHQNLEFLRLLVMELVNCDHLVTISDTAERVIRWDLVQPNVRFEIQSPWQYLINNKNYHKLGEGDMVVFDVANGEQYHQARQKIKLAHESWNTRVTFAINTKVPEVKNWVLRDKLEVVVNPPKLV
jgi:hypothetical protein